jgi:predicted nucleotidyltransferase
MPSSSAASPQELSPAVERMLADLVESAGECFRDDLRSVVLFGSGAEGRLRSTSDLNLLIVLKQFDKDRVDAFREPLRVARVAGRAVAMFVLESELPAAAEAFAVKFDDIGRRRRVLFGDDVLVGLEASRESKRRRLRQVLLNLAMRLRQQYATASLHEEQLASRVADAAGPLRSAAATILELEGKTVVSPKQALEQVVGDMKTADGLEMLRQVSRAREDRRLPPKAAGPLIFQLIALAEEMRRRAERIQ